MRASRALARLLLAAALACEAPIPGAAAELSPAALSPAALSPAAAPRARFTSDAQSRLAPFFERLASGRRAEVRLTRRDATAEGGAGPLAGRVVLEPPDRVRVEFEGASERITLRSDGGEWLQPELRQLVRLGNARARAALVWWDLLLGPGRDGFEERPLGPRSLVLIRRETAAAADSVFVTLDGEALPATLRVALDGMPGEDYRLSRWKFSPARGRADFVLRAPAGYETTVLP